MQTHEQATVRSQNIAPIRRIPPSHVQVRWMRRDNGARILELGSAPTEPSGQFTIGLAHELPARKAPCHCDLHPERKPYYQFCAVSRRRLGITTNLELMNECTTPGKVFNSGGVLARPGLRGRKRNVSWEPKVRRIAFEIRLFRD
jgi:hypothetical protein